MHVKFWELFINDAQIERLPKNKSTFFVKNDLMFMSDLLQLKG